MMPTRSLKNCKKGIFTFPALLWAILIIGILTLLSILFLLWFTKPISVDAAAYQNIQQRWILIDAANTINVQTSSPLYQYMDLQMVGNHIQQLDPLRVLMLQSGIDCAKFTLYSVNPAPEVITLGGSGCIWTNVNSVASYIVLPNRVIQMEVR